MQANLGAWKSRPAQWLFTVIIIAAAVFFLFGCADPVAPESKPSMRQVETFEAALKKTWTNSTSICDPGGDNDSPGKIPEVNLCFAQLLTAFGVGGATVGKCAAAAAGSATVGAAIGAWSVCGLGVMTSAAAFNSWLDATQADAWADWSENEIANRMQQMIFERMMCRAQAGKC